MSSSLRRDHSANNEVPNLLDLTHPDDAPPSTPRGSSMLSSNPLSHNNNNEDKSDDKYVEYARQDDTAATVATEAAAATTSTAATTTSILMEDMKLYMSLQFEALQQQHQTDMDRWIAIVQQESAQRLHLEQRFHAQLLLQSEAMVAMELKLLRLEQQQQQQHLLHPTTPSPPSSARQPRRTSTTATLSPVGGDPAATPTTIAGTTTTTTTQRPNHHHSHHHHHLAVISTSQASFTSGVTSVDERSLEDEDGDDDEDDILSEAAPDRGGGTGPLVILPTEEDDNDSDSTPTLGSRTLLSQQQQQQQQRVVGNMDSILHPMMGETAGHVSTRATRGEDEADQNSTLATQSAATGSTFASTIITSATTTMTRGDFHHHGGGGGPVREVRRLVEDERVRTSPRSRSNSPLTVQDEVNEDGPSSVVTTGSTSLLSNMAVASGRYRRAERHHNRVVTFPPEIATVMHDAGGDSITMPDELDNLSVNDSLASSVRMWREEYEARLDALQKRWSSE